MIASIRVRPAAVATVVMLLAGCGSFGANEPAAADAGADASMDASADGGAAGGDAPAASLPTPQDCVNGGTTLAETTFDTLPPSGWNETDPGNLLMLDMDAEDVVSAPSSFRAGTGARSSGGVVATIQRALQRSLAGTICVTFQGRLDVGGEGFGTTEKDYVGLFGAELQARAGDGEKRSIGVAVDATGLRLHIKDPTQDHVTPSGVAYGDDVTYQRWTLIIGRAAREVAFWIGPNHIDLPLDMPFDPGLAAFTFGVAANGKVPAVTLHMDDVRIALLP